MIDPYDAGALPPAGMDAPFIQHEAAAPSDAVDFARLSRAVFIGGAGDVALVTEDGVVLVYTVPAGTVIPGRFRRVNLTGTTATQIRAWS